MIEKRNQFNNPLNPEISEREFRKKRIEIFEGFTLK